MNVLASECSSGCESGWTVYLEQSLGNNGFANGNDQSGFCDRNYYKEKRSERVDDEEEEEEDLSMVSDASSGPPHFQEDEVFFNVVDHNSCFSKDVRLSKTSSSGKKKKSSREQEGGRCGGGQVQVPSFLDDTASSPVYNFSMNDFAAQSNNQASMQSVLEFSQGLSSSANHFEGRSAYQEYPFGFYQSSLSGNQLQKNQWFEEKGMGMR